MVGTMAAMLGLALSGGSFIATENTPKDASAPVFEEFTFPSPILGQPNSRPQQLGLSGPAFDKRVSVNFENAHLGEILKYLSSQGFNYVVEQTERARQARFSISIKDAPLRDVLQAIADVYGGEWSKSGSVLTLVRRSAPFKGDAAIAPGDLDALRTFERMIPGSPFRGQLEEFAIPKEQIEKIQEMFRGKGLQMFGFDEKSLDEWTRRLKEKMGGIEFKMHPPSEEEMARIREKLERLKKGFKAEEGRTKLFLGPEFEKLEIEKLLDSPKFEFATGLNLEKLIDSLSAEQKALHEKQGHLSVDDLTVEQKKLLGSTPSQGSFTISIVINGKKLTIKR